MKRILHILKRNDPIPISIIQQQAKEASVEVVLSQDATSIVLDAGTVFELADHTITDYPPLSYKELVEKIFLADTVVTW